MMPTQPRLRINVPATAALLLAGMIAAPVLALAAPEHALLCENDGGQALALTAAELSATPVNSSEEMLHEGWVRDAEAAHREIF